MALMQVLVEGACSMTTSSSYPDGDGYLNIPRSEGYYASNFAVATDLLINKNKENIQYQYLHENFNESDIDFKIFRSEDSFEKSKKAYQIEMEMVSKLHFGSLLWLF